MRRFLNRSDLVSWVTIGFVLGAAASAGAQNRTRGQVTDEWGNGLAGATVDAEPTGPGSPQTATSDEDGRFEFGLLSSGDWFFTATMDGYQGVRLRAAISQLSQNRPIELELPALPQAGSRFRERTEFEADGGMPRFRFEEDGSFEFEDAEGEGEGTYGIVELSAILIVRDYDGPDDKFNVQTPIIVEFSDQTFASLTHDGLQLQQLP